MAKVTATMPVRLPPARSWMMALSGRPRPTARDCALDIGPTSLNSVLAPALAGGRALLFLWVPPSPQPILADAARQCRVARVAANPVALARRSCFDGGKAGREDGHGLRDDHGAAAGRRPRRGDRRRRSQADRRQPHLVGDPPRLSRPSRPRVPRPGAFP